MAGRAPSGLRKQNRLSLMLAPQKQDSITNLSRFSSKDDIELEESSSEEDALAEGRKRASSVSSRDITNFSLFSYILCIRTSVGRIFLIAFCDLTSSIGHKTAGNAKYFEKGTFYRVTTLFYFTVCVHYMM